MKKSSFILILALFLSCNKKSSELPVYLLKNSDLITLKIDPFDSKKVRLSENTKSIEYIVLEEIEGIYFAEPLKISLYQDKIFLLDEYTTKSITCYDTLGKFKYQIKNIGKGPGEYADLENFIVNRSNQTLELYERTKQRISVYDIDNGKFIKTKKVGFLAVEFELMANGNYVFFADDDGYEKGHPLRNKLIVLDKNIETLKYSCFPFIRSRDDFETTKRFSIYDNNMLFTYAFNDTIYSVKPNGLMPSYSINFGRVGVDEKFKRIKSGEEKLRFFFENQKASLLHELNETENYLSFWYRVGKKQKFVLYNKEDQKFLNVHEFHDDINNMAFPFPKSVTEDGRFASVIYPEEMKEAYSQSNTSLNSDKLIHKIEKGTLVLIISEFKF